MKILLLLLACAFSIGVRAESNLLVWDGEPGANENPPPDLPGAEREWRVNTNMRGIMQNEHARAQIRVVFPGRPPRVFELRSVEPIAGFEFFGHFDYRPNPQLPDSAISYSWYGASGSDQLTIAVWNGRMSATIQSNDRIFPSLPGATSQ